MQEKPEIPINLTVNIEGNKDDPAEKLTFNYNQNAIYFQKSMIQSLFLFNGAVATAIFASKNEELLPLALWFALCTMLSILAYMFSYNWQICALSEHIHNEKYENRIASKLERRTYTTCKISFAFSIFGIFAAWFFLYVA